MATKKSAQNKIKKLSNINPKYLNLAGLLIVMLAVPVYYFAAKSHSSVSHAYPICSQTTWVEPISRVEFSKNGSNIYIHLFALKDRSVNQYCGAFYSHVDYYRRANESAGYLDVSTIASNGTVKYQNLNYGSTDSGGGAWVPNGVSSPVYWTSCAKGYGQAHDNIGWTLAGSTNQWCNP